MADGAAPVRATDKTPLDLGAIKDKHVPNDEALASVKEAGGLINMDKGHPFMLNDSQGAVFDSEKALHAAVNLAQKVSANCCYGHLAAPV